MKTIVTVDGPDCIGKTTLCQYLGDEYNRPFHKAIEPGTSLSYTFREYMYNQDREQRHNNVMALVAAAATAESINRILDKEEGGVYVMDRGPISCLLYQTAFNGVPFKQTLDVTKKYLMKHRNVLWAQIVLWPKDYEEFYKFQDNALKERLTNASVYDRMGKRDFLKMDRALGKLLDYEYPLHIFRRDFIEDQKELKKWMTTLRDKIIEDVTEEES